MENSSSRLEFNPNRHTALRCDVKSQEKGEMNKRLTRRVSLGDTVELVASNAKLTVFVCAKLCHIED